MSDERVAVVTVSYNTIELTALLLWSLHCVSSEPPDEIVVVDNASTDGSLELLREVASAGLVTLLSNATNRHHGPALNDALAFITARADPPRLVWILDSDVVVARSDTLERLRAEASGAAVVGERMYDQWHDAHRFELYSFVFDPSQVWRPELSAFDDSGDPAWELLRSVDDAGLRCHELAFAGDGYVVHRGRGTLDVVAAREEIDNPLYEWALDHREPHFGGVDGARERYVELLAEFRVDVPELTPQALVAACRRGVRSSDGRDPG